MIDSRSIYNKQVQLLLEVLPYVSKETCFALKGGTAINMFVRDMPRLSVDIDLMYLPIEERTTSLTHISEALERIATTIEAGLKGAKVHRQNQKEFKGALSIMRVSAILCWMSLSSISSVQTNLSPSSYSQTSMPIE